MSGRNPGVGANAAPSQALPQQEAEIKIRSALTQASQHLNCQARHPPQLCNLETPVTEESFDLIHVTGKRDVAWLTFIISQLGKITDHFLDAIQSGINNTVDANQKDCAIAGNRQYFYFSCGS